MSKYTIDTALSRLSEIADCLESGEYDLDSSLKLYEEGVKLVAFCNDSLSKAKQKIYELSKFDEEQEEEDKENGEDLLS